MRSFTVLILCLYSRSSHHRRWELYVTRIDSWCPLAPVSHFWLLKSPKVGVGQCAQGGIPVIHLWFLHWWGIGLEATCRSLREKWQCWDLPLILKGRVTVTYTWGRHSCAQCHQCRDLRESTIWGDWFPYLDCSNERRCFIQPTFNSGTFPTSSFWNIRTRTAQRKRFHGKYIWEMQHSRSFPRVPQCTWSSEKPFKKETCFTSSNSLCAPNSFNFRPHFFLNTY